VRVLVVEDSAPNRKLLCALLTRLRCAVTAVENGQLCVDLMRPHFATNSAAPGQVNLAAADDKSPPPPVPFDIVLMVRLARSQQALPVRAQSICFLFPSFFSFFFCCALCAVRLLMCLFLSFAVLSVCLLPCPPVQDNSMPVMDGVTATRLLREGGIALPVVGVTGNALEEDIRSFMKGGATEILVRSLGRQRWAGQLASRR
jgi:CheY-like chemotaxis protein